MPEARETPKVVGGNVPTVRQDGEAVGIFLADMHLSEMPPVSRCVESGTGWLKVQKEYMLQLAAIQLVHKCPIFIAGDIFNKWDCTPHLLSHAISWFKELRDVYAIPGNHDIPNHNRMELGRSAFWVLVEAGVITPLSGLAGIGPLVVYPFPYGSKVEKRVQSRKDLCLHVALIHDYIWTADTGHPFADEGKRVKHWYSRLEGYDVAFYGDNHIPFSVTKEGKCTIVNAGCFIKRSADEISLEPRVWLLFSDGFVSFKKLNTSQDRFLEAKGEKVMMEKALEIDLAEFTNELLRLNSQRLDFCRTVLSWIERANIPEDVKSYMLRAIGTLGKRGPL
jgi:hypothetical protein